MVTDTFILDFQMITPRDQSPGNRVFGEGSVGRLLSKEESPTRKVPKTLDTKDPKGGR